MLSNFKLSHREEMYSHHTNHAYAMCIYVCMRANVSTDNAVRKQHYCHVLSASSCNFITKVCV